MTEARGCSPQGLRARWRRIVAAVGSLARRAALAIRRGGGWPARVPRTALVPTRSGFSPDAVAAAGLNRAGRSPRRHGRWGFLSIFAPNGGRLIAQAGLAALLGAFFCAGAAGAAEAPRMFLRAFSGVEAVVEPQPGFWPDGVWLTLSLGNGAGAARSLDPPQSCVWTSAAYAGAGPPALAAFCAPQGAGCRGARSYVLRGGEVLHVARERLIRDLAGDGAGRLGWVSRRYAESRGRRLGLAAAGFCDLREPLLEVRAPSGEVAALPLPQGARLRGLGAGDDPLAWIALPGAGAKGCEGAGCRRAERLARLDPSGELIPVSAGGAPARGRALAPSDGRFLLLERCELERLGGVRVRSRCDLWRSAPPGAPAVRLTRLETRLGDLALSPDGRTVAAVNPFEGRESRMLLIDAASGAVAEPPAAAWLAEAFAATGLTRRIGEEE